MIFRNPEFIKNVKLEFSLTRFAIPVILLFLFVWIGWSAQQNNIAWQSQYSLEQIKAQSLFGWLCGFGFLFTIVWGTYLVSSSLLEEMKLKTWDFVRMSSMSPLKILAGKMFGAPSVVWVITLLGVLPCLVYAAAVMIPDVSGIRPAAETIVVLVLCIIFWTILSYSLSLLLGLMTNRALNRSGAFSMTAVIFFMGSMIGNFIKSSFDAFHKIERYGDLPAMAPHQLPTNISLPSDSYIVQPDVSYIKQPPMADWYGIHLYSLDLFLLLLAFFSFWAFVGAWWALRKSLQYRDAPWVWLGFIVSTSIFLSGFAIKNFDDPRHIPVILFWPILVSIVTMFFASITEAGDIVKYRSFARKLAAGVYYEAFRSVPLWMISFVALFASMLLSLLTISQNMNALLFFISLMGFVVRDQLAFHAISWAPNVRRPLVGLIIYLAIVYALLPIVARTIGSQMIHLFFPLVLGNSSGIYWPLLAIEILVASYIFRRRWIGAFEQQVLKQPRMEKSRL